MDRPPPAAPPFAALHAVATGVAPEQYLRRRARGGGDPFAVRFPGMGTVYFTARREGVREVFQLPPMSVAPPSPSPISPLVGDQSVIMRSGPDHRRERALLMPPFHGERVRGYIEAMGEVARREVDTWPADTTVDARAVGESIGLQVIIDTVFGVRDPRRRREYLDVVARYLQSHTALLMLSPASHRDFRGHGPWARFLRHRGEFEQMLDDDIALRRRAAPRPDVLGLLLDARYDDGSAIDSLHLRQELATLLVAGHETVATTLAWALLHLARDGELRARLHRELDEVGEDPHQLAHDELLGAICAETLRMHPPVSVALRRMTEPQSLWGIDFPEDTTVAVAVPALHWDPRVFPEPAAFRPDRFLAHTPSPFEYAPFGGAHRLCIGHVFADYELRIALGTIFAQHDVREAGRLRRGIPRAVPRSIATRPSRRISLAVSKR